MHHQAPSFGDSNDNHPISNRAMKQQKEMNMKLGEVYMNDSWRMLKEIRRFKGNQATMSLC
jgi:hypothetical protein